MKGRRSTGRTRSEVIDWIQKPVEAARLLGALRLATDGQDHPLPRILHVEDDTDVANVVAGIMGGLASIDRADGLRAAKHLLQTKSYDLVILDLAFPDGSGSELLPLLPPGNAGGCLFGLRAAQGYRAEGRRRARQDTRVECDLPRNGPTGAPRYGQPYELDKGESDDHR